MFVIAAGLCAAFNNVLLCNVKILFHLVPRILHDYTLVMNSMHARIVQSGFVPPDVGRHFNYRHKLHKLQLRRVELAIKQDVDLFEEIG